MKKPTLSRLQMAFLFALISFAINILSMIVAAFIMYGFASCGIANINRHANGTILFFMILSCVATGFVAMIFSKIPLKPFRKIKRAADQIAKGDYSVRISENGPDEWRELASSFNHMTEQLANTELLSNDFINHFSHEFKTPIVSIRGFAKMLENDDLSPEEKNEYLDIIIKESERLADLSNNVLSLSRVEQQTILTNKKSCNISEQIRLAIAMLDSKWSCKDIKFHFDSGEYFIKGNEELLQQVWTNLLDNAVKFSEHNGTIDISIHCDTEYCTVLITNHGEPISEESKNHIFDKFYQGDHSHHTPGNGLGLAIAYQIIRLHGGNIKLAESTAENTTFEVQLPINN